MNKNNSIPAPQDTTTMQIIKYIVGPRVNAWLLGGY